MNPLTPQQRMDKNGKIVTRHVRTGTSSSASISIPAPSKVAITNDAPTKKWRQRADEWPADEALKDFCSHYQRERSYVVECTDNEVYEVMGAVSGANALPLLCAGVRSKEDTVAFLENHGFAHLIEDNEAVMMDAQRRELLPVHVMKFMEAFGHYRSDKFLDAMETFSMTGLRTMQGIPPKEATWMVLLERISLSDIKKIGPTRISNAGTTGYPILDTLAELHSGTSKYDSGELRKLLSLKGIHSIQQTMQTAEKYGMPMALRIARNIGSLSLHEMEKLISEYGEDGFEETSRYINYVIDLTGRHDMDSIKSLYHSGVDMKDAARGINEGLTDYQIIATGKDVEAPLAKGWL